MNPENPIIGALRQQWLALVAIVTVGAAYVRQSPSTPVQQTGNNSGIVSFPERLWDDPFAQIEKATKALEAKAKENEKSNSNLQGTLDFSKIFAHMQDLVEGKDSHILVCLNVLDAQDIPSAIESRIRTRHAFEIGLSNMKFLPVDQDTISYLQATIPTFPNPLVETSVPRKIVLPIKLYQNRESKKLVLNIWFNQQHLRDEPLPILAGLLDEICQQFRQISKLAIIGPGDSDKLKAMRPIAGHYTQNEIWGSYWLAPTLKDESNSKLNGFQGWKELFWISTSSTVPRDVLWGSLPETPPAQSDSSEFQFRSFIDSDKRLISSLANELRLRIGTYSPKRHDILLFVEQDKEYGRNLGASLTEKLVDDFHIRTVPYLRGLSGDQKSKDEISGVNVTDYFERTLARLTDSSNFATSQVVSPAAIGILGARGMTKMYW